MTNTKQTDSKAETPKKKSKKQWIIENVVSLGLALFLVMMIRSSVIEAYKIPSGSMIPTLLVGDHIFVNKFSYGLKVPFTEWFGDPTYIFRREPPKRGDIIVFKFPRDESVYYIKRVVATPGEVIEVREKKIFINGNKIDLAPLEEPVLSETKEIIDPKKYRIPRLRVFNETMSDQEHLIMHDDRSYFASNYGPATVPEGHYFVMGDNRDHSNDSRFWGYVPMENVKGRAVLIWLSAWLNFDTHDFTFRPERTGTILR